MTNLNMADAIPEEWSSGSEEVADDAGDGRQQEAKAGTNRHKKLRIDEYKRRRREKQRKTTRKSWRRKGCHYTLSSPMWG